MKKRGKRGEAESDLLIMLTFSLIAAAFILILFIKIANSLATDDKFETTFEAYDTRYLLHSMYAVPHNIVVYYPANTSKYTFAFDTNQLDVYPSRHTKNVDGVSIGIVPAGSNRIKETFDHPEELFFSRTSGFVRVGTIKPESNSFSGPQDIETALDSRVMIIDPAHDAASRGSVNYESHIIESEFTMGLAGKIMEPKITGIDLVLLTRDPAGEESLPDEARLEKINGQKAGVVLSIHAGNYGESQLNPVKIFYRRNDQSRKLAYSIAESIKDEYGSEEITGVFVVPSDDDIISQEGTEAGISMEIGNIMLDNNALFNDTSRLSGAVRGGIRGYLG